MSSPALQIAKDQLSSITDFQRDMHVLNENDSIEIESPYYKKYVKTPWRSCVTTKFASHNDGDVIIYPVNPSFHYLEYTYLSFKLPAVRVKDEWIGKIRIAYCHDAGNNIRTISTFNQDHDVCHTIDNVWGDIHPQFYQEGGSGKREGHKLGTGIINYLENWSEDYLPPYTIDVDQPWFYSNHISSAYPIWMNGSLPRASHRYTFKKKVVSLLRVDLLKNGKWISQKANLSKYVDIIGPENIGTPELWGRYGYVSDDELKWNNTCDDTWVTINDGDKEIKQKTIYTRDVVSCDMENPTKYKKLATNLLKCANPCLAFFWVAENRDSTSIHNYSNYTTNTNNVYDGWDPIKYTTFKLGKSTVFDKMDSHHFSIAQPRKHFPSTPWMTGYHGYSNTQDSTDSNGYLGVVYDELTAVLNCRIDNNDIYINRYKTDHDIDYNDDDNDDKTELDSPPSERRDYDDKSNDLSSPNFIVRTRLLIVRKFTITNRDGVFSFEIT